MEVGSKLGHFEILEPLGAGGMGEVYRARDTKLDREVAIKVLPEDFAHDHDRLARFEREAKLLASLNHANIATIHGLEEDGGIRFIAMELVEGETLADRIATSGPIGVEEALSIAHQIAEALEVAHERGIMHRDLKPANVIVTPDGKVKVLDFGLAKAFEARGAASGISPDLSASPTMMAATQAGVILGTAAYMSPEQARGKPVDKRTDIWAFGCVLYEILTGVPVFAGETATDILGAIVHRQPDFGRLPPSTPASVVRLLRRCLAKEAGRRARDAWDLRVEVAQALEEPDELPVSARAEEAPGWRGALPWVVAVAAVLIAGLSFVSSRGTPTGGAVGVMRFVMPVADGSRLVRAPSISPDGSLIAFAARPVGGGAQQLYLRRIGADDAVPLAGTDFALNPFFSPDGQWIGFGTQDKLMKIAVTGGAAVLIADTGAALGATWTEDDRIVFVPRFGEPLMEVPAGGGKPTVVASLSEERREEGFLWPSVLPGGDAVLVTITTEGLVTTDEALIAAISLETGEQTILVPGGSGARFVETGHIIYARAGTLRAVGFDPETLRVREPSVQVLEGLSTERTAGIGLFAAAANGTLVYLAGGPDPDSAMVWVDRQGNVTPAVEAREGFDRVRISPDGQRAAVIRGWASHELWIYDLSRGTAIPLEQRADTHSPLWAPDGRSVFYSRRQGGRESIFVRSADGRGEETRLIEGGRPLTITPDGTMLIVARTLDGVQSIWQLPLEGAGTLTRVHDSRFREGDARLSPDGRWLAYAAFETGRSELYLEPYPGAERRWQVSTSGAAFPRWSGDSSELFFADQNRLMSVVMLTAQDPPFQEPTLLFESGALHRGQGDVAPSGDRFLTVELPSSPPPTSLQVVLNWFEELKRLVPVEP